LSFRLVPTIREFTTYREFAAGIDLGQGDLVFTTRFLVEPFVAPCRNGAHCLVFEDYCHGEPTDQAIDAILAECRRLEVRRVIAVGGGSVIDIGKLLALSATGSAVEFFEKSVPLRKEKELLLVPTTCGTGSEVTNITIAEITAKQTKMGLAVDELFADQAVLIPELIQDLPDKVFAASSIDALVHATEAYVSPKANAFTRLFSREAMNLIIGGYRQGSERRRELMGDFLRASCYAGIAFGNAGVGAVHALSYPLGGRYHVPHGESNYQFFTEVFKVYRDKSPDGSLRELNQILAELLGTAEANVYQALDDLLGTLIAKKPLREYGMSSEEIDELPKVVVAGQQRLLANNYVPLAEADMRKIYASLY
jgi:4-hydroxybutyrate dehydrogenase